MRMSCSQFIKVDSTFLYYSLFFTCCEGCYRIYHFKRVGTRVIYNMCVIYLDDLNIVRDKCGISKNKMASVYQIQ